MSKRLKPWANPYFFPMRKWDTTAPVHQPPASSSSGRVSSESSSTSKRFLRPCPEGMREVSKEATAGSVQGAGLKARVKQAPSRARRSMWGLASRPVVRLPRWRAPRVSTTMTSTLRGSEGRATSGKARLRAGSKVSGVEDEPAFSPVSPQPTSRTPARRMITSDRVTNTATRSAMHPRRATNPPMSPVLCRRYCARDGLMNRPRPNSPWPRRALTLRTGGTADTRARDAPSPA